MNETRITEILQSAQMNNMNWRTEMNAKDNALLTTRVLEIIKKESMEDKNIE